MRGSGPRIHAEARRDRGRRALLIGFLVAGALTGGCGRERPWNVLLVTFDTTRADHLGPYGKTEARTPTLDQLAAEGVVFERAFSAVPITCPSHSTIHTGTYPLFHGVRDNGFFVLPEERTTLAEILSSRGYATGAAIGSYPLLAKFGLDQGFELYDDHITASSEDFQGQPLERSPQLFFDERPAGQVNDALLPWLKETIEGGRRPFFAWAHYFDPHQPLTPPSPYDQLLVNDLYLGEIAYADESLGHILDLLRESGELERTLVVMTADHGEGRGEHDEDTHALLAYNTTLHVPLILRFPGQVGGVRVVERVGTVDIMPTVLSLLGLEIPEEAQGRSLVPAIAGTAAGSRTPYYAETLGPRLMHGWGELRALFLGPLKYIYGPRPELYDIEEDPGELHNLIAQRPQEAQALEGRLRSFLSDHAGAPEEAVTEVDSETLQRLAALGYLSSSGEAPSTGPERLSTEGTPPQDQVGQVTLMSQTKALLHEQRFLEARALAERLVSQQEDNPFYTGLLAWSYVGVGQLDEAVSLLEGIEQPVAYVENVYLATGRRAFLAGARERGLELVVRLVAAHASAESQFLLADMYQTLGRTEQSAAALAESLRLNENYVPAQLNMAIRMAEDGYLEDAETQLRRALANAPLYPMIHFNLAKVLVDGGQPEPALRHLNRAVELQPTHWQAQLGRMALLLDLGRRPAAARVLKILRNRCPDPQIRSQAEAFWRAGAGA